MIILELIKYNHAALKDSMLQENIVFDAVNLLTGILSPKSVLHAILTSLGTNKPMLVNVAQHHDLSKQENVSVPLQRLNGTPIAKLATVHLTLMEKIAKLAQLQDSGILPKINVFVQHQKPHGIHQVQNVNVQLESTENIVLSMY